MALGRGYTGTDDGLRPAIFGDFRRLLDSQQVTPPAAEPCRVEVLDKLGKDKGWLLRGVLTPAECAAIISVTEQRRYQDADEYCFQYVRRHNDRMMCEDTELAQFVWDRISPHLPQDIDQSPGSETVWRRTRLNERWRFCRYYEGHYFGHHADGTFGTATEQSFWTCMLYLNEGGGKDFDGGTTDFVSDVDHRSLNYRIVPKPGLCIVFKQADSDCIHLGAKLLSGTKYIMRTDVMFSRERKAAATCTQEPETDLR